MTGASSTPFIVGAYMKGIRNYDVEKVYQGMRKNHIGKPWLTQHWSRAVVKTVFGDLNPNLGYSGDEDQGLMGSLAAIMKMGLFELRSGAGIEPKVDLGSPIFDKITIHLDSNYYKGDKIEIVATGNSNVNRYLQQFQWNNKELLKPEIDHKQLTNGGVLNLQMGNQPKK